jgi:alkylation response protein AidB-like acyl-CoA dehydrogenase
MTSMAVHDDAPRLRSGHDAATVDAPTSKSPLPSFDVLADAATEQPEVASRLLRTLIARGELTVPPPGAGATRHRFEMLVAVGTADLTVGRLAEAHLDALAILTELGAEPAGDDEVWAVWAAEPPKPRVTARLDDDRCWRLAGRKAWCSGAGIATHALVTADAPDGARLFAIELAGAGVHPIDDPWPASALSGTDTRSVDFSGALATAIGAPNGYVERPGFWHGAAGVAAVWYGGAVGVAGTLLRAARARDLGDIGRSHLGAVATALAGARAALDGAADAIDADPADEQGRAAVLARTTRAVVEAAATDVIDRVGRALGPAPLALDGSHARRVADLQLYLRQSHADRDLADLGARILAGGDPW